MNKIQGIYLIKNVINGKVYVGQSNDVLSRIKSHFSPKVYLSFSYPLSKKRRNTPSFSYGDIRRAFPKIFSL